MLDFQKIIENTLIIIIALFIVYLFWTSQSWTQLIIRGLMGAIFLTHLILTKKK